MCVYLKFVHHPYHVGYLCAKFRSFAASIAQLARGEKLCTQSTTHSLDHSPSLFDAPGTETFALEFHVFPVQKSERHSKV